MYRKSFWTHRLLVGLLTAGLSVPAVAQSVPFPTYETGVDDPAAENFQPWSHVPNLIPLNTGVTSNAANTTHSDAVKALRVAWLKKKSQVFEGKLTKPDSEDSDTVNHLDWYEATGFTRPYPGEKKVRPASDFNRPAPTKVDLDD